MCEHKYQVLDSTTETFFADSAQVAIEVSAIFYCEKCLDIKRINKKVSDIND